jgi:hypothetical protein
MIIAEAAIPEILMDIYFLPLMRNILLRKLPIPLARPLVRVIVFLLMTYCSIRNRACQAALRG